MYQQQDFLRVIFKIKKMSEEQKIKPKKEVQKPNYIFTLPYLTAKKNYQIEDKIYLDNEKTIEFLTAKKIIKKWQI